METAKLDAQGIAELLGGKRARRIKNRTSPAYLTFCPHHDDRREPSLLVSDGYKATVMFCYAGCAPKDVLASLKSKFHCEPVRRDSARPAQSAGANKPRPAPPPAKKKGLPERVWHGKGLSYPPRAFLPKGFREVARWPWHDAAGNVIMWNIRMENDEGRKEFMPMSVWSIEGKPPAWTNRNTPLPRPLYDIHKRLDDGPILMVEGEKCVAAARYFFGDDMWITTAGASTGLTSYNTAPLFNRDVIVATDMDGPGLQFAQSVTDCASPKSVTLMRIPSVLDPKEGDDLADLKARGITPAQLEEILREHAKEAFVRIL